LVPRLQTVAQVNSDVDHVVTMRTLILCSFALAAGWVAGFVAAAVWAMVAVGREMS
jgi:hypothetical protein